MMTKFRRHRLCCKFQPEITISLVQSAIEQQMNLEMHNFGATIAMTKFMHLQSNLFHIFYISMFLMTSNYLTILDLKCAHSSINNTIIELNLG